MLSIGIVILLVLLPLNNSLTVLIVYNLICFIFLLGDYFTSVDARLINIDRIGSNKLSIYEEEYISFEVYNKSNYRLNIELRDEIPEYHFKSTIKPIEGYVLPHEKKTFQYMVEPTKRGAFIFRSVYFRWEGRFKLCKKVIKLNLTREYKVYPNLKNLRKYKLSITNNRIFRQGQRNIKMLGRGTSFESLREYVSGDEYRKINWKATARSNKPIINLYEPEKNQHIYMFIDTGRPMSYMTSGYRKLDLAVNTALVLSDVANGNGDKSGLLVFNTKVNDMIMPGKGPGHRTEIMNTLYHVEDTKLTSNYDDAFYYFKSKERHRSIIFFFTDFDTIEEAENLTKLIPVIAKNNIVIILLIKNEKLEIISTSKIKNTEDLFNKGVSLELKNDRHKIISLLNRQGFLCIETEAEKLEYTAVNKYIQVKNRTYL